MSAAQITRGLVLAGSTSGALTFQPAAVTTNYAIVWPAVQGAANTVPTNDGAGNLIWAASGTGTSSFVQSGNSFAEGAILGTIDNNTLVIITHNITALTFSTGQVATFNKGIIIGSGAGGSIQINGSSSGSVTMSVPSTITPYSLVWPSSQGAADTVLSNNGSGSLSWTSAFINGGNSFNAVTALGTNDGNDLVIKAGNVSAMTVSHTTQGVTLASTLNVTTVATMNTLTTTSNVSAYAPLTGIMTGTVAFYGDSITVGQGVSASLRYSALLCTQYGCTELNNSTTAVSGAMTYDATGFVYGAHTPGNTSFINIGTNDVFWNSLTADRFWQSKEAFENLLLWLCLPTASVKINRTSGAHSADVTRTGTWTNATWTNVGAYTTTSGGTASCTVNGRYVGFAMSFAPTNPASVSVTIDGIGVYSSITPQNMAGNTILGSTACTQAFVYDTGAAGNHTVLVTTATANAAELDYMFGFDSLATGSHVVVIGVEAEDFNFTAAPAGFTAGDLTRQTTLRTFQQRACWKFRTMYGARVYYVDQTVAFPWGSKQNDNIHPNTRGHVAIQARVNQVLTGGEIAYWV